MMLPVGRLLPLFAVLPWLAAATAAPQPELLFEPYGILLERHVVEHDLTGGGLVSSFDYRVATDDADSRELIARQRDRLAELETDAFDDRGRALAFWINAYNFFMIAHIVDNPEDGAPVDSVKDFGRLLNPFRVFERRIFVVAGRKRSLDEIEKKILLGDDFSARGWKDARVHFAVNCASVGCPPLRKAPYSADNVERLLEENTRRALATPLHLAIEGDSVHLTSLFDWYARDFEQAAGSVDEFIRAHLDEPRQAAFGRAANRRFIDYDWRLNSPDHIEQWLESRP